MIDQIVAYGCSYTAGEGIDHFRSWPYCLGYNFNIRTINYGAGGCSNKFITSQFFRDLDLGILHSSIVVIAWTSHLRTAFWNDQNKSWDHYMIQYSDHIGRKFNDIKYFYSNMFTEYNGYFESLVEKIAVRSMLEKHKIPYVFLNSLHEGPFWEVADPALKGMREQLKNDRYMDFDNCMHALIKDTEEYICSDGFHPSEKGHIYIADRITEHIKKHNLLEIK